MFATGMYFDRFEKARLDSLECEAFSQAKIQQTLHLLKQMIKMSRHP